MDKDDVKVVVGELITLMLENEENLEMLVDENDLLSVANHDTIMREKGSFLGYYGSSVLF